MVRPTPAKATRHGQSRPALGSTKDLQLPALPTMVLSDPTWTFAAPLMAPWTTMTRGPEAIAAAES
jgi:hypothetical protein